MIDSDSPVPAYKQIAQYIKTKIEEGIYKEGTKIPTEVELMKLFGVSRVTVRLAIKEILKNDLVERKQGKGTFVKKNIFYHQLSGIKSLYETLLEGGVTPETELLYFNKEIVEPEVAKALQIKPSDHVLKIHRLYHIDQEPAALSQISLHNDYAFITYDEAKQHTILQLIEEKGKIKVRKAFFEFFAENASAEVANALQIDVNDAVLGAERIHYNQDKEPIEHTYLWFKPDLYRLTLSLEGNSSLSLSKQNPIRLKNKNNPN